MYLKRFSCPPGLLLPQGLIFWTILRYPIVKLSSLKSLSQCFMVSYPIDARDSARESYRCTSPCRVLGDFADPSCPNVTSSRWTRDPVFLPTHREKRNWKEIEMKTIFLWKNGHKKSNHRESNYPHSGQGKYFRSPFQGTKSKNTNSSQTRTWKRRLIQVLECSFVKRDSKSK